MLNIIKKHFKKPKGIIGRIVGRVMAAENKTLNEWTVRQLKIRSGHRILEVGYGPGYSIDFILDQYPNVRVDGLDVSNTMKDQAAHRLSSEIKAGKVHLSAGAVEQAVFQPNHYHRIFTVNNFTLWQEKITGLQELHKALVWGGRIAITMQPRQEDVKLNQTRIFAEEIRNDLAACGFKRIKVKFKRVSPEWAVCVTASKT